MAFTHFDEQTYISGVWIFDYPSWTSKYLGNIFAQLYKQPGSDWHLNIIQRTYVDDKVHGSDDRKQYFQRGFPADTPEADVVAVADRNLRGLCEKLSGAEFTHLKVHGNVERWFEVAKLDPRLHVRVLSKDEQQEVMQDEREEKRESGDEGGGG